MNRTPSLPRGPPAPLGTFNRFRAEIAAEKAGKATTAASQLTARPDFAQVSPRPGQYWQVKRDKKVCPVVVCDEDLIANPQLLNVKERPDSAARPDGTWHESYVPHVDSEGTRRIPVLFLETVEFCWLLRRRLLSRLRTGGALASIEAIDGVDDAVSLSALRDAFVSVVQDQDLAYWKSAVLARRLSGEAMTGGPDAQESTNNDDLCKPKGISKRKLGDGCSGVSHGAGYPRAIEIDDCMDDSESRLFLNRSTVKREQRSGSPPDLPEQEARRTEAKRQKTSPTTPWSTTMPPYPIPDDHVRIFVGNPHHAFLVPKASLHESPLLPPLLKIERGAAYLMSPLLSSLPPRDFHGVAAYLTDGDYAPHVLGFGTPRARLEPGDDARRDPGAVLRRCATLFGLGTALGLSGLRDVSVRKVVVLARGVSYEEFLAVVPLLYEGGGGGHGELHAFVVGFLARHFWEMWEGEGGLLRGVLRGVRGVRVGVFGKMVEWADGGVGEGEGEEAVMVGGEEGSGEDI